MVPPLSLSLSLASRRRGKFLRWFHYFLSRMWVVAVLAALAWLAQVFTVKIAEMASDYVGRWFETWAGFHDDLRRLRASLFKAHPILSMTEKILQKHEAFRGLLAELHHAAQEAEQLLKKFHYGRAEATVPYRCGVGSLFFRGGIAAVRRSRSRLDSISADVVDLNNWLNVIDSTTPTRKKPEEGAVRTNSQLDEIVELLLKPAEIFPLPILRIVDEDEMRLARQAYHDKRVDEYFQLKMWVGVSEGLQVERLTRKILDSSSKGRVTGIKSWEEFRPVVETIIASKRFLLIFDDVRSEDQREWAKLLAALMSGSPGSKILVTTPPAAQAQQCSGGGAVCRRSFGPVIQFAVNPIDLLPDPLPVPLTTKSAIGLSEELKMANHLVLPSPYSFSSRLLRATGGSVFGARRPGFLGRDLSLQSKEELTHRSSSSRQIRDVDRQCRSRPLCGQEFD